MRNEYFKALFENSIDGVLLTIPDGTILDANQAACAMLGMTVEEIQLAGRQNITVLDDVYDAALAQRGRGGNIQGELTLIRKDGTTFPIEYNSVIFGEPARAFVIFRDISSRKHLEEQLRARAEEVEALMSVAPVALFVSKDPKCNLIVGNKLANEFYEADDGENVSANVTPVRKFLRDGRELASEELPMQQAARDDIDICNTHFQVQVPSGGLRHLYGSASPLHDEGGGVRGCIGSFLDVTELWELKEQTQRLLRTKDEFLAMCSHEMKTPLTVLITSLDMFAHMYEKMTDELREKQVTVLRNNAHRLNKLVSDLLDYSRLETGHISLTKAPIDINNLLVEAVEGFRKSCTTHCISLESNLMGSYVDGDPSRLTQVLNNLLSNAVRYSEEGTHIKVQADFCESSIKISVADRGQGISEKDIPLLFDRYFRCNNDRSTGGRGSVSI